MTIIIRKFIRNRRKLFAFVCILATIGFIALSQELFDIIDETQQLTGVLFRITSKDQLYFQQKLITNQTSNQRNFCRLPNLELTGHENIEPYVKCKQEDEWGYLKTNRWRFNQTVIRYLFSLQCKYRVVTRIDDFKMKYSDYANLVDNQLVLDEVIEVICIAIRNNVRIRYSNLYVQIVAKRMTNTPTNLTEQPNGNGQVSSQKKCEPMNIILLSYDSLSRVSWFKRLTKTTKFIFEKMDFKLLYGQSILGDGTPACMIPLLTGKLEHELPSTLKSDPDGKYVDQVYPFIWNELHSKGYMSFHMEDWPQVSAFTYRLRGMSNRTAHHYMRAYQVSLWKRVSDLYFAKRDDFCIGNVKRHKKALDLITEFIETYKSKDKSRIAIMHYIENSHDGNDRANYLDQDLYDFLNYNLNKNNFERTAIFLYSDHGARFSVERLSPQGYLEERTPFFSLYLPDSYRKQNPAKYLNLIRNTQQITTPFDIYRTIRDLTCLEETTEQTSQNQQQQQQQAKPNVNNNKDFLPSTPKSIRSISLLDDIPSNRSCEQVGISLHYCICEFDWNTLNVYEPISLKAVQFIIDYINVNLIDRAKDYCEKLLLKELISIKKLSIKENNYFKIRFTTSPNNAKYEALLKLNVINKKKSSNDKDEMSTTFREFIIESPDFISRSNPYGNEPKCLEQAPPSKNFSIDLRKFCLCRKRLMRNFPMAIRRRPF